MFNIIKTAALSAMIGLGALAAAPATAQADGLYLNFGGHQAGAGFYFGDSRHSYRRHHRDHRRHFVRGCSTGTALYKASRMGVRHARVTDVGRHSISVRGRKHHHRVHIRFARAPGCPIIG
jgi:hypothetical protein